MCPMRRAGGAEAADGRCMTAREKADYAVQYIMYIENEAAPSQ